MDITKFIEPELLVLVVAVYIIGRFLKRTQAFEDRWIPATLGFVAIVLAIAYVGSVQGFSLAVVVAAAIQGILIAGAAVYSDQLFKQLTKGN